MEEKETITYADPAAPDKEEEVAEKISEELNVSLPGKYLPLPIRLIAYFTLIGGLSIIGSLFADIVRPQGENPLFYVLRTAVGVMAIGIAYGILEKKRWAIWLYGVLTLVALNFNPFLAVIPIGVVIYLTLNHRIFKPSHFDRALELIKANLKNPFRKNPPQLPE